MDFHSTRILGGERGKVIIAGEDFDFPMFHSFQSDALNARLRREGKIVALLVDATLLFDGDIDPMDLLETAAAHGRTRYLYAYADWQVDSMSAASEAIERIKRSGIELVMDRSGEPEEEGGGDEKKEAVDHRRLVADARRLAQSRRADILVVATANDSLRRELHLLTPRDADLVFIPGPIAHAGPSECGGASATNKGGHDERNLAAAPLASEPRTENQREGDLRPSVALLVDSENMTSEAANPAALLRVAASFGDVNIARAYAEWIGGCRPFYLSSKGMGMELVQTTRILPKKNTADIRLAADAVRIAERGWADTVVLATSDSDFLQTIQFLRSAGIKTVLVTSSPSSPLHAACDHSVTLAGGAGNEALTDIGTTAAVGDDTATRTGTRIVARAANPPTGYAQKPVGRKTAAGAGHKAAHQNAEEEAIGTDSPRVTACPKGMYPRPLHPAGGADRDGADAAHPNHKLTPREVHMIMCAAGASPRRLDGWCDIADIAVKLGKNSAAVMGKFAEGGGGRPSRMLARAMESTGKFEVKRIPKQGLVVRRTQKPGDASSPRSGPTLQT